MEKITQANATAANLLTNFTPTNTMVPSSSEQINCSLINKFELQILHYSLYTHSTPLHCLIFILCMVQHNTYPLCIAGPFRILWNCCTSHLPDFVDPWISLTMAPYRSNLDIGETRNILLFIRKLFKFLSNLKALTRTISTAPTIYIAAANVVPV